MQLSPHFTLEEMTKSEIALERGIANVPHYEQIENLKYLCLNVLEPIRAHFKAPILISSGYRSPALNQAVGSHDGSHHMALDGFAAADFTVEGKTVDEVFRFVASAKLPFVQAIDEFGKWVHVSAFRPRQEALKAEAVAGRTVYTKVLA